MNSFEVNIRICQPENSDIRGGQADIAFFTAACQLKLDIGKLTQERHK